MNKRLGFTSTIPVEIVFAAGYEPVDINNIFISDENPGELVEKAKMEGFPDTTCAWICGLYGTIIKNQIPNIVGVTGGDCAETIALMEVLSLKEKNIIHFDYPSQPDIIGMEYSLNSFAEKLGTTLKEAENIREELSPIREKVESLDRLLWESDKGMGSRVQLLQLGCTDFEGDPISFSRRVDEAMKETRDSKPEKPLLKIGMLGVPPIISNLYNLIEEQNYQIAYSEVQRQFSLPYEGNLAEIYTDYTYPYGIYHRLNDIKKAIKERQLDGIIHYTQSFCFRGIEDIVLRNELDIPILTLQGDLPTAVTATMEIRIEAFTDMLLRRKGIHI